MFVITELGAGAVSRWRYVQNVAAVSWGVISVAVKARHWPRTVRAVLAKQVIFTGVDALKLILLVGFLAGISIVAQVGVWVTRLGQSELLGSVLCAIVVREIAPLLVNFIVIGRSGTAVATELAGMKVRNEINVLEAQGIDPMIYLVMPRTIGMVLSVFCLGVFFVVISLGSGYLFGLLRGSESTDPGAFLRVVMTAVTPSDIANFLSKTLIPPLLTGVICCLEGIGVRGLMTDVPQAATRGVVKSIIALIIVSAVVSLLTYA
ncbi:MAG: hypothetical protein C0404_07590 [Verrucomicrobia bacterium]|nr:hypothetical protein [Verrucomicrobiota bacterium]